MFETSAAALTHMLGHLNPFKVAPSDIGEVTPANTYSDISLQKTGPLLPAKEPDSFLGQLGKQIGSGVGVLLVILGVVLFGVYFGPVLLSGFFRRRD